MYCSNCGAKVPAYEGNNVRHRVQNSIRQMRLNNIEGFLLLPGKQFELFCADLFVNEAALIVKTAGRHPFLDYLPEEAWRLWDGVLILNADFCGSFPV